MTSREIFKKLKKGSLKNISDRINRENDLEQEKENCDNNKRKSCCRQNFKSKNNEKKADLEFLTENKLPERLRKDFPPEFYGQPIEEIDDFHKTENVSFKFFILFLKTHNFLI